MDDLKCLDEMDSSLVRLCASAFEDTRSELGNLIILSITLSLVGSVPNASYSS